MKSKLNLKRLLAIAAVCGAVLGSANSGAQASGLLIALSPMAVWAACSKFRSMKST